MVYLSVWTTCLIHVDISVYHILFYFLSFLWRASVHPLGL
jgi:hypothetical protein